MSPHNQLPSAPEWSLLLGQIGRICVWLMIGLFLLSAALSLFGRRESLIRAGAVAFYLGTALTATAFGVLMTLFVTDRFEFVYVFNNSRVDYATHFKAAAVWAGQEGSILLWALCSALAGLLTLGRSGPYRRWYTAVYALIQGWLAAILAYESPFRLLEPLEGRIVTPPSGNGMTAALHNIWMLIHPPIIFIGFGILTSMFAFAVAALMHRNLEDWIPRVRPVAIAAMTFVGLGLCLGGFWAYETLGWGGFWMWDPVENTSFVPWVIALGFIHGAFIQQARRKWYLANPVLAALPFLAFCYGTFLTRSGFLAEVSVHSFAQMDRSALWLLITLIITALVGFIAAFIYAIRKRAVPSGDPPPSEKGHHREGYYTAAVWLMLAMGTATFIGMSIPLWQSILGRQAAVVEEGVYHDVLVWFFVPAMLVMAVAPFLGWRGLSTRDVLRRVNHVLAITFGLVGVILLWALHAEVGIRPDLAATIEFPLGLQVPTLPWVMALTWLCVFVLVANMWRLVASFPRAKSSLGGLLTHVGFAMTILGLIFSRGLQREAEVQVQEGMPARALEYRISLIGSEGDFTHRENEVHFRIEGQGKDFVATPGLYYQIDQEGNLDPFVWPHVQRHLLYDLYLTAHPMVFDATEPTDVELGGKAGFQGYILHYYDHNSIRRPEEGFSHFGALVEVTLPDGTTKRVEPYVQIRDGRTRQERVQLDDRFMLVLDRLSAEDYQATFRLEYVKPLYPIEFFYKPFTGFVWLGVGIMSVGGLLAAWLRRPLPRRPGGGGQARKEPEQVDRDAPVPASQIEDPPRESHVR